MTGKTHMLGGICLAGAVALAGRHIHPLPDVVIFGAYLCGSIFGSLIPDIDETNSKISRKLPFVAAIFSENLNRKRRASKSLFITGEERDRAKRELRDASHRGWTHYLVSWVICLLISLSFSFFELNIHQGEMLWHLFIAFLLGIVPGGFSHIFLDIISGKIPLFAPFYRKNIGICLFKTGGLLELVFVRTVLFIVNVVIFLSMIRCI